MYRTYGFIALAVLFLAAFQVASASDCANGVCNRSLGENFQNCRADCLPEPVAVQIKLGRTLIQRLGTTLSVTVLIKGDPQKVGARLNGKDLTVVSTGALTLDEDQNVWAVYTVDIPPALQALGEHILHLRVEGVIGNVSESRVKFHLKFDYQVGGDLQVMGSSQTRVGDPATFTAFGAKDPLMYGWTTAGGDVVIKPLSNGQDLQTVQVSFNGPGTYSLVACNASKCGVATIEVIP